MEDSGENLHELSTAQLLRELRAADRDAIEAAHAAAGPVGSVVDALVDSWPRGGRLIYVGAGTSGRIGVLDAAECHPTFGVEPSRVTAVLAGGSEALAQAAEGAEDNEDAGREAMAGLGVGAADVVVGLSASGATPFTCAALEESAGRGATTAAVTCGADSRLAQGVAIPIVVEVGREVIEGSTRMKAGTAQKLVCNAISTAAFIRLGHVWGQHMIGVRVSNEKLRKRAEAILQRLGECADEAAARALLAHADYDLPTALLMARAGLDKDAAERCLEEAHGDIHEALRRASRPASS